MSSNRRNSRAGRPWAGLIRRRLPPAVGTSGGGGPRRRRPITLRTKLIAGIVAVIVVVCGVIGVVTEMKLRDFLVAQKDAQLTAAQSRVFPVVRERRSGSADRVGITPPDRAGIAPSDRTALPAFQPGRCTDAAGNAVPGNSPLPPGFLFRGVQSVGTLGAMVAGGSVVDAGILSGEGACTVVDSSAARVLADIPPGGSPATVHIAGQGDFRVLAETLPGGDVAVLGLPLADVHDTLVRLALIMIAVAGGGLLAGGLIVFVLVRRSLRPLERMAAAARTVATLQLDHGAVDLGVRVPERDTDPRTEVGQVGAALNQMLGHVSGALQARHASEQRVRRFVADASHELRTPLAAIRGYAELARRGEQDAAMVAHALRRVESESARMTSLVDDMLLLARLDAGRSLESAEVDLTALAVDAVSDARVAGPHHRWRLDLPDEPVTTIGDRARLQEVLANLLANARSHTPAGTTVVTALSAGPQVELTVTDDGPGIPLEQQPEVFGRFVRGDASRSRAVGSTGLGLAIVAAVVAAHHGTVTLDSRPGRTTFRVVLPGLPAVAMGAADASSVPVPPAADRA